MGVEGQVIVTEHLETEVLYGFEWQLDTIWKKIKVNRFRWLLETLQK